MHVWRLARSVYSALDGEGARLHGGRWNEPGTPVVYTSASLSLAALELLVHLDPNRLPDDLVAYKVEVPDALKMRRITTGDLPEGWNRQVEVPALRRIGEAWAKDRNAGVLRVPSAVIPEEQNVLINPRHPDAGAVHVTDRRPIDFRPTPL
jgi:RES domain-containing protein